MSLSRVREHDPRDLIEIPKSLARSAPHSRPRTCDRRAKGNGLSRRDSPVVPKFATSKPMGQESEVAHVRPCVRAC